MKENRVAYELLCGFFPFGGVSAENGELKAAEKHLDFIFSSNHGCSRGCTIRIGWPLWNLLADI